MAAKQRQYHKKYKFIVSLDGFGDSGWQKAGPLEVETAVIEHREGGSLIPNKSPGLVNFSNITLERGFTDDVDLYNWFLETSNAVGVGTGLDQPHRDGSIVQQNRDGSTAQTWNFFNAWPTKFVAGEWDNTADEVTMQTAELAYDYFELV